MPRKAKSGNRGGRRAGNPATAYPNRSDLNETKTVPPAAFTGQAYGQATQQARVQQSGPRPPAFPPPGSLGDFAGPTARPDEPLTAGAPVGPGPGPESLGVLGGTDTDIRIRALYQAHPSEPLREIIESMNR